MDFLSRHRLSRFRCMQSVSLSSLSFRMCMYILLRILRLHHIRNVLLRLCFRLNHICILFPRRLLYQPLFSAVPLHHRCTVGAILKKWTAKSERWYNNKKRRETHGKHQVYRGIQAKHSKLV